MSNINHIAFEDVDERHRTAQEIETLQINYKLSKATKDDV